MPNPIEYAAQREKLHPLPAPAGADPNRSSTGPRTPEGKARSSQNATRHGLFATREFLSPEDSRAKVELTRALLETLCPGNPFEQTFADEIVRASWRLKRCAVFEETNDTPAAEIAVNRARAQSLNILLKATSELRRLQTHRRIGFEIYPEGSDLSSHGLANQKEIVTAIAANHRRLILADRIPPPAEPAPDLATGSGPAPGSFGKTPETPANPPLAEPQIARNALCPCHSGEKYKRCCGKNAPPVLFLLRQTA